MTIYELWMIFGKLTVLEGLLIIAAVSILLLIVRWILLRKAEK